MVHSITMTPSSSKPGVTCTRVTLTRGHVMVVRDAAVGAPASGQVRARTLIASVCDIDLNIVARSKQPYDSNSLAQPLVLGHESVVMVDAVGPGVDDLRVGQICVVLPHNLVNPHDVSCLERGACPLCAAHGTHHLGVDVDGVFADYVVLPRSNFAPVPAPLLARLAEQDMPADLPTIAPLVCTEPLSCMVTGIRIVLPHEYERVFRQPLQIGKALVLGAGPIGSFCALVLRQGGWDVQMGDIVSERACLACALLGQDIQVVASDEREFDLVVVATSAPDAARRATAIVRKHGAVLLAPGMSDLKVMDVHRVVCLEPIRREIRTALVSVDETRKLVFLTGWSGYEETYLRGAGMALVVDQMATLTRLITGRIDGWQSAQIQSRLPGGKDWGTLDGSPALVHVFHDDAPQQQHIKLVVVP